MPTAEHVRLTELIEELAPDLAARGYQRNARHQLWARDHPHGLLSLALAFAPDDEEGGWVEPFVGLLDQRVETLVAMALGTTETHGVRHTLMVGSTKWYEPTLDRQPIHSRSDVLEVANAILRWWDAAMPTFTHRFADPAAGDGLAPLDALFNAEHPQAKRYAAHPLYRALRGLAVTQLHAPAHLTHTLGFHRERLRREGYWELYGEQVQAFVLALAK